MYFLNGLVRNDLNICDYIFYMFRTDTEDCVILKRGLLLSVQKQHIVLP